MASKAREVAFLAVLAAYLLAGAIGSILLYGLGFAEGRFMIAAAALLGAGVLILVHPINVLRHVLPVDEGDEYVEARGRRQLQAAGTFLGSIATLVGLAIIGVLVAPLVGVAVALEGLAFDRVMTVGATTLFIAHAVALWTSVRIPTRRQEHWSAIATLLVVAIGASISALVVAMASTQQAMFGPFTLDRSDAAMVLLGTLAIIAFATILVRDLPTLLRVLLQPQMHDPRGDQTGKAAFAPALVSLLLLFFVVLLLLVYGIGLVDALQQVSRRPELVAVLVASPVLFLGAVWLTFRLGAGRPTDDAPLFKEKKAADEIRENWILGASTAAALALLLVAGAVSRGLLDFIAVERWFDIATIGVLTWIGPYGFYAANRHKRMMEMEERFPDFLRDLASSHQGGLTLYSSVEVAARGDYGALTPEIRKMADQITWNVSFEEALRRFARRANTPLIERAVSLILEAGRSGGNTVQVLLAAARDAREIKTLEQERRLNMSLYTIVIYVVFLVFLLVAAMMYGRFVPELINAQQAAKQVGTSSASGVSFSGSLTLADYRTFYFLAAVVQGLGDGIVAGMMGQGRLVLGLRHSFIMVLLAWIVFSFFL